MRATVSSSFIAMRAKVSRISRAAAIGIRVAVRAFRIDVNQAHLHGTERIFEIPVAGSSVCHPASVLGAPVDVFFRFQMSSRPPAKRTS